MSGRTLSRRKIAEYLASELKSGKADDAIKKTAAYLKGTGQKRSVDLLVRDVEEILAKDGIVVADLTSARPLSSSDKKAIADILGAKELHTRDHIDSSVLGGVKVEVSGKRLDATLRHKIDSLKEITLRKGTK